MISRDEFILPAPIESLTYEGRKLRVWTKYRMEVLHDQCEELEILRQKAEEERGVLGQEDRRLVECQLCSRG